jgi:hypothetical protein
MPTTRQQLEIALRAHRAPRTVLRAYRGEKTHATTFAAVSEAARELGLPTTPASTVLALPSVASGTAAPPEQGGRPPTYVRGGAMKT